MSRILIFATNTDDLLDYLNRHSAVIGRAFLDYHAVWPTAMHRIDHAEPFTHMLVTAAAYAEALWVAPKDSPFLTSSPLIRACLMRVKGPDGLTPGQRITADEIGARMRGTT